MGLIMEKYLPELISGCFSSSAQCIWREEEEEEEGRLFAEVNEWRRKEKRERARWRGGWIELAVEERWSVRSRS